MVPDSIHLTLPKPITDKNIRLSEGHFRQFPKSVKQLVVTALTPTHRVRLGERSKERKKRKQAEEQTLDLEPSVGLAGRLDSSKPSSTPPLTEVPPLQESGVVGLALAASAFFFPSPCLGADLERRWRTVQPRWRAGLAGAGGGSGGGCALWSRSSMQATTASSVIASLTHSSSLIFTSFPSKRWWGWWKRWRGWRRRKILFVLYGRVCVK
jgi:hypothetical protein